VIGGEAIRGRDHRLSRDLLCAIEHTRSRLAVAIAAENKATPRERWRHYLETEERLRKCLKEIRQHSHRNPERQHDWYQALNLLRRPLPATEGESQGDAQVLCQRMYEVLAIIENHPLRAADEKTKGEDAGVMSDES
jgi:hypothetical protein